MKKYTLHKNFIPKSIVLEQNKKEENRYKRVVLVLFIGFLITFPLMKSDDNYKEEKVAEVKVEKKLNYNHENIIKELEIFNINIKDYKNENGNIEASIEDMEDLSKLEKIENFKVNTITEVGNNKFKVSIRRE